MQIPNFSSLLSLRTVDIGPLRCIVLSFYDAIAICGSNKSAESLSAAYGCSQYYSMRHLGNK